MPELAEPPPAAAPMVSLGDAFRKATADIETPAETPEPTPKPKAAAEKPEPVKKEPAEKPPVEKPVKGISKSSVPDSILDTPKADEPAAEAQPDPLAEIGDGKSFNPKKAREIIETHRKTIAEKEAEIAKLSKSVEAVRNDPETKKQLEAREKENAELRDAITALNVEYDPQFREKYVNGRQKLLDKAIARVKENGGDPEGFADALKLTGKRRTEALKEALEQVDEIDKPRILSALDQIQSLDDERADIARDPQQAWERIERDRKEAMHRQHEEAEKIKNAEFDKAARELPKDFLLLRTLDPESEGAGEWNGQVKTAYEQAKRLFEPGVNPSEIVATAVKGVMADKLQTLWLEERQLRIKAEKQLAEYDKAEPAVRGNGKPAPKEQQSAGDRYRAALEAARGADE